MKLTEDLFSISSDLSADRIRAVAERFKAIIDNSNDGLIVFGSDYRIYYANPAACAFVDATHEEIIGAKLHELIGEEAFTNIQDLCEFSQESHSKICSTIALQTRNVSRFRHLEICIYSDTKCGQGLTNLYLSDQTELNRALSELRNKNAFFNNLIDSSVDGIIAADMTGKIILFNKGAQRMTDWSEREALTGLHVTQLYPKGEAREIMRKLRSDKFGGPGRLFRHELTGLTKTGSQIPLSLSGSIIYNDKSEEIGTLGIFTDMRQIKQIQRELQRREEELFQSERMASLGKLAAGVAHEINNPLTGILTFAEDLIDDSEPEDERLEDYKVIHREAMRCREIVRDLLDFAKQDKLSTRPININLIVMQTFSLVKRLASFQNIEITHNLSEELPMVVGDTTQLQQVFLNMMVNASEAMPQGGELYIATRTNDRDEVDVSFSDTGPGIPPETLKKIFEPFFSTKGGKTNGLGLAVSWGIIESHGGRVEVETAMDQGTTFHVMLPIKSKSPLLHPE